jgi:hypothetical protein
MTTNMAASKEYGWIAPATAPSAEKESLTWDALETAICSLENTMLHL